MTIHVRAVTPATCPALVLNADFRPLSYYPLSIWCWQDAIKAVFLDRVNILSEYETRVRSPSFEMRLPSVVSLKSYVKPTRFPAFTRFNVFLRDRFTCQYCGGREDLTFDHVVPRSKGGITTWENVVAACSECNLRKADLLPAAARMWPAKKPYQPTVHDLHQNGRLFPPNYLHESWMDFLYWDSELEEYAATARRSRPRAGPSPTPEFNQGASSCQIKPYKTKQNSLDLLVFIWFYLVELGLINGLRAKK